MEPEIISRECIKPSSPTPLHLRTHKLCLLDQIRPRTYFPMTFYYPFNQDGNTSNPTDNINLIVSKRLQLLKKSLSETLPRFYPIAGKFKDDLSVDCNDAGIYFAEARVKASLDEFLRELDFSSINKFIPLDAGDLGESVAGLHVGKIQVTKFSCGGLVICACVSHLFGDGKTLSSFVKNWAATAACGNSTNEKVAVCPSTEASVLFPQNNEVPREATWEQTCAPLFKTGSFVTGRFLFDARAIGKLKAKATSPRVQNPTRVEVVSAIFSKCLMAGNSHKPVLLTHSVNLRGKTEPPMSEYAMGNIVWTANAMCTNEEEELDDLVLKLREAIRKLNGDFVKSLRGEKGLVNVCESAKDERQLCAVAKDRITFSSWCNFGLYDIDFGWGKPSWVSNIVMFGPIPKLTNTIVLIDTKLRDGIEAWVYVVEEDMKILQVDKELQEFATLNPSPL